MDNTISINQSIKTRANDEMDGLIEEQLLREIVADNIKLEWLLEVAENHSNAEVKMVNEVYEVICDMVCYPRESVVIRQVTYPWRVVKSRFLKLTYSHVASLLNRIVDSSLQIRNMAAYLVSSLYTASLTNELEMQASIHDDYLKMCRGNVYS